MPKNPQPRKLSIPISIGGPEGHRVRILPEDRDGLELAIVGLFTESIAQRLGRRITNLARADPWPDFMASEDGAHVGIEVAEVVDLAQIVMQSRTQALASRATDLLSDIAEQLAGICVEVGWELGDPEFPPPGSPQFEMMAEGLAENIRRAFAPPVSWIANQVLFFRGRMAAERPITSFKAKRLAAATQPFVVVYQGYGASTSDRVVGALTRTLKGKLDKQYDRTDARLLLLLYYPNPLAFIFNTQLPKLPDQTKRTASLSVWT